MRGPALVAFLLGVLLASLTGVHASALYGVRVFVRAADTNLCLDASNRSLLTLAPCATDTTAYNSTSQLGDPVNVLNQLWNISKSDLTIRFYNDSTKCVEVTALTANATLSLSSSCLGAAEARQRFLFSADTGTNPVTAVIANNASSLAWNMDLKRHPRPDAAVLGQCDEDVIEWVSAMPAGNLPLRNNLHELRCEHVQILALERNVHGVSHRNRCQCHRVYLPLRLLLQPRYALHDDSPLMAQGYFGSGGSTCAPCPVNSYKNVSGNAAGCAACPANATSTNTTTGSTSSAACLCNVGYTGTGPSSCVLCAANKYKATIGNVACTSCATGGNTNGTTGGNSTASCLCSAGYYGTSNACVVCPKDTYKSTTQSGDVSLCLNCAPISSTASTGATASTLCLCRAGYYGTTGNSTCLQCPVNTYKATTASASSCTACSATISTTNGTIGGNSTLSCMCTSGYYSLTGNTNCTKCPVDTYGIQNGLGDVVARCLPCDPMSSTANVTGKAGSVSCLCRAGYYGTQGNNTCLACPVDYYKATTASATACTKCATGSTTGSVTGANATTQCFCTAGYYGTGTSSVASMAKRSQGQRAPCAQ